MLVKYIIGNNKEIKELLDKYVDYKLCIPSIYFDKNLYKQEKKYKKKVY